MAADDSDGDGGERARSRKRQIAIYAILVLALAVGVAAAAHITGTVSVSDGVSLQAPDGMNATLTGSTDAHLESPFPTSGSVEWTTEAGNISFFSGGSAAATVHKDDIEGTWTNVTAVDADPNSITIDPADKDSAVVGQAVTAFAWRGTIAEDDGTVDFTYSASAPGLATVQGVTADTQLAAIDADSGAILDDATSSGGGVVTFDGLDSGTHDVQIQAFDPATPTLSNPDPTGGTSSAPQQVSIDVNDADFPAGDSVTVTIDINGNQVNAETLSSNGTVTASVPSSAQTGGTHTWTVNASDAFGETANASYSYVVPQNLTVYDEETLNVIDDRQVNLTVYTRGDDPEIHNFSTSDGSVDLGSGFPSAEPFVVVAQSDGYLDRRIFVQSVYETQNIYLLNESLQYSEVIFRIQDFTGEYPPSETVLEVQRGLDGNWTTVLGDYFGANDQFESQLRFNERHRLVIRNSNTGESRVLGSYTPLASGTETITVSPTGQVDLPPRHPTFEVSPGARQLPSEPGVNLNASIARGDMPLQNWSVRVEHINGSQTQIIYTENSTAADGGEVSPSLDLDNREGSVRVTTEYALQGGGSGSSVQLYSLMGGAPTESMTLLEGIAGMVGLVPSNDAGTVTTLTAMILVLVGTTAVGTVFRMSTEAMGLVTLTLVGAFAILGWVDYTLLFTLLVLFAAITFVRRRW